MGKMNDYFPSPYLKAEDLDGPVVATIKGVRDENFTGQRGEPDAVKPVVFFREHPKGMIINRTNYKAIIEITGQSDTDDWAGARVQLRVEQVPAFGDLVDAIRVRPVPKTKPSNEDDDTPSWVLDPA